MNQAQRLIISLRYWLNGRSYFNAARALDFALEHYHGVRKDGVTPVIVHPVTVAQYVRTLSSSLLYPEDTLATALLHDLCEDYNIAPDEIREHFGERVADAVWCLTKEYEGVRRNDYEVFVSQAVNPIASIVKGADRINNIQTMIGVFSTKKQKAYIEEATTFILPMLKNARRNFPEQEMAYENIKLALNSQIALIREIHAALDAA